MQYRAVRICAIHCSITIVTPCYSYISHFARDPGHNYLQWVILTILSAIAFKPPIPMCRSDIHTARRYCCFKSWIWTDHLVACSGIAVTRCDCWLVRTSCFWPKAYIYLFWHVPVRRVIEVYSVQYSSEKGSSCAAIARVACLHPMLILCFAAVQKSSSVSTGIVCQARVELHPVRARSCEARPYDFQEKVPTRLLCAWQSRPFLRAALRIRFRFYLVRILALLLQGPKTAVQIFLGEGNAQVLVSISIKTFVRDWQF